MGRKHYTVLIVDDSPTDRASYRQSLRQANCSYQVVEATLGQAGLEQWQQCQPDVVILEYCLPDMDGLKFLDRLKTLTAQSFLPVVMVTGQGNETIAVQAMKAGVQDYLVKQQVTPDELRLAVDDVIEKSQLCIDRHCAVSRQGQPPENRLLRQPTLQADPIIQSADLDQQTLAELAERKRVETALQMSEEQLRLALDFTRIGAWDWNILTHQVMWNDNHFHLLGLNPTTTQASYQTWRGLVHPADIEDVETAVNRALATHTNFEFQYRVIHPDGSLHWLMGKGRGMYDETEQPTRMLGVIIDITTLKQMEHDLRQSEERFRRAILNAPLPIMLHTEDGEVLQISNAWTQLSGYSLHHIPTIAHWLNLAYGVHAEQVKAEIDLVYPLKHPLTMGEYQVTTRIGNTRIWDFHVAPLGEVPDGRKLFVAMAKDVTERKRAEADLQRYKDIFQFSEQGLAISKGLAMEWVNPAFAQMHGYTVEEMVGKPILDLFPVDYHEEVIAFMQRLDQTGHANYESFHIRKDGSVFPILLDITVVKDEQGYPLYRITTLLDMTEHHRIENERKRAELEAYRLNQRLQHLIRVIQQLTAARDLKTIIHAVRSTVHQLMAADGATFVLRDGDESYYLDEDAIAPLWKGRRFPLDSCLSGWVILNQQPAIIADVCDDPRVPLDLFRPTFVKSLVMLPIGTTYSIGAIGTYWSTSFTPTPEEVNLLQSLADAAAIAIENVRFYETLEQRVEERTIQLQQSLVFEALLKRITDKVRDSLNEQHILQTVVDELAAGLDLECCDTGIYNAEQTTSTIAHEFTRSLTPAQGSTFAIADSNHPEIYRALFQGELRQFCNLSPNTIRIHQPSLTILSCPIQDDQGTLGDLWLFKSPHSIFNEQEVRLVQQVANQCAIALRQSRLYQAVQSQVTRLEQLNQLKDDFLSTVSHELRAPMANIKMATQMLTLNLGITRIDNSTIPNNEIVLHKSQTAKAIQYLQILNKECQRETGLINDLLDLARLDAGTVPLTLTEITISEWIPRLIEAFIERIQQQQQQLKIHISSNLPLLITDLLSLERVLTELLQNACKYTPPAESIVVTVHGFKESVQISVSNSGTEIPIIECDRIFDKFYRIPNNDPWKYGGTGLGLALVKKLVDFLQGSISVTSENNWTTFSISLPWQLQASIVPES